MSLSSRLAASRYIQPGVCTSTTRPASPYEGQVIYETDTNQTLTYSGSAWIMVHDLDTPSGLVLIKTQTIGNSVASVVVSDVFSAEFDSYRVIVNGAVANVNDYSWLIKLNNSTGSTYNNLGYYGAFSTSPAGATGYANSNLGLYAGFCSTTSTYICVDLHGPFKAAYTSCAYSNSGNGYSIFGNSLDKNAASSTGFTLVSDDPTPRLTGGTIRVYGYRNTI